MRSIPVLMVALVLVALASAPPAKQLHKDDLRPLLLRPVFAQTVSKPILPMLVDLLWLRALNAIGLRDNEQKNTALHEYGVAITDLDRRFLVAYEYIGLNIPYAVKRNTWVGGDLASDLFRRGLVTFPASLKLHMYLGFSLFHYERKFSEAGDVFAAAAKLPNALPYMAPLAARLKAHSGAADEALELTKSLLAYDLEDSVRKELEQRLAELRVEAVLQQVDRAATTFQQSTGRPPRDLNELRVLNFYDGPSTDPSGGFISLDDEGKATSTSLSRRVELYE